MLLYRIFNLCLCLLSIAVHGAGQDKSVPLILFLNFRDLPFGDSVTKTGIYYSRVMEIQAAFVSGAFDSTKEIWKKAIEYLGIQNTDERTHLKQVGTNQMEKKFSI